MRTALLVLLLSAALLAVQGASLTPKGSHLAAPHYPPADQFGEWSDTGGWAHEALEVLDLLNKNEGKPTIAVSQLATTTWPAGMAIPTVTLDNVFGSGKSHLLPGTKKGFPSSLYNFIEDLRVSVKNNNVFETGTAGRGYHIDELGMLPKVTTTGLTGLSKRWHEFASSKKPQIKNPPPEAKGYMEYTPPADCMHGVGNGDLVRVLLDYVNWKVYITVTHYRIWDNTTHVDPQTKDYSAIAEANRRNTWFHLGGVINRPANT